MVDEAETVKVIDFGSATVATNARRHACYVVSRFYRAPELLLGAEQYSEKIDIWSIGCILWEIIMGSVLFSGADAADQMLRIIAVLGSPTASQFSAMKVKDRTAEYVLPVANLTVDLQQKISVNRRFPKLEALDFRTMFPGRLSGLADIISKTLQYDPDARPSAAELLRHPFFTTDLSRL